MGKFISAIIFLIIFVSGCATPGYIPPTGRVERPAGIYHRVKQGETVLRIARAYDVDMDRVVKANRLSDADRINEGQLLFIPRAGRSLLITPQITDYKEEDFIWPLRGRVISGFGASRGRITNKGVDIQAREGAAVVAAKSGRVIFSSERIKGYGKMIIIDHADGYQTVYTHNSANLVKAGQFVQKNSPIAKAGATGRAEGPCLHFEIRRNHRPCNPFHYLP